MKLSIIIISIALGISVPCFSQWARTNGPSGGHVSHIVKINDYLFLNAGPGGVYRSEDDGNHWAPTNNNLPNNPHCFAIANTGSVLYASIAEKGIYKSIDFGLTWSPAGTTLQGKTFYSILADGNDVYAGPAEGGIYYSNNGGNNWVKKANDLGQVRNFLIAGGNLFVAASTNAGVAAVFKSTDKGDNLLNLNAPVTSINIMGGHDNAIYLTGGQPTAISRDFGATWTTSDIATTGNYMLTSIYAHEERVIIPGGNSTLFVSEDEGVHWETVTTLPYSGMINAIYCEGSKIILGSKEGIYMSNDHATTWLEKNQGLNNLIITQLKATDEVLFAGTGVGIFLSTDNGVTWNKRNNGLENNSVAGFIEGVVVKGIHVDPDYTLVATSTGVFKSPDHGLNWNLKRSLMGIDLNNRFQILAANEDRVFACENEVQHYSISDGETWSYRTDPVFDGIGILNATIAGDTIIVLAHEKILISKNFGTTWQTTRAIPTYFYPTDAAFVDDRLYVATYQGLFVTTDLTTWTKVAGLPTESVLSLSSMGTTLYAGTTMGLYVSYHEDLKWYPLNDGMTNTTPYPLAFNTNHIFAGTYGMSVWHNLRADLNVSPVITGLVSPLEYTENQDIIIDIEDLEINDPDNSFPGDFTLVIKDGPHYDVAGNVVTPEPNYSGELKIHLVVTDGRFESNEYIATVNLITGIEESRNGFELFPNPVTQQINFRVSEEIKSYSITDFAGRRILHNENLSLDGGLHSVDVSQLPAGVYFIELQGHNHLHQRFMKH